MQRSSNEGGGRGNGGGGGGDGGGGDGRGGGSGGDGDFGHSDGVVGGDSDSQGGGDGEASNYDYVDDTTGILASVHGVLPILRSEFRTFRCFFAQGTRTAPKPSSQLQRTILNFKPQRSFLWPKEESLKC